MWTVTRWIIIVFIKLPSNSFPEIPRGDVKGGKWMMKNSVSKEEKNWPMSCACALSLKGNLCFREWWQIVINPPRPDPKQRGKINLNFYFHTSLWCLKRFYEGHCVESVQTFWSTTKRFENKNLTQFLFQYSFRNERVFQA